MAHCLIVDDSSVVRKVARRILEDFELSVSEAEDGRQALEMCRSAMPDAIFVDWFMPVMDGFDFVKALRAEEGGERPKVVFCTTENDVGQIARAMRVGADELMLKPFDKSIIESKLQDVGLL
ncbi:MAG: response regulator [Bauldia sp.]|nr:response regulator [Bauldia sp.]